MIKLPFVFYQIYCLLENIVSIISAPESWANLCSSINITIKKVYMRILIDADGCPVVDIAIKVAKQYKIECVILCDTSHVFEKDGAKTITVTKGADSVDFVLVNMVKNGDVVITQDYGLAAMCLSKLAVVINQDGMIYDDNNIDALLLQRHTAKKIRMAGGRLKGNPKRTIAQDIAFENKLIEILDVN